MSTMNHRDPGISKTTLIVEHTKILDILMYVIFNFLSVSTEFNNYLNHFPPFDDGYSAVSIKNIDILPNWQYIANTADSAQERYS